jgi:lysophospholipid acyltransferase (LPLAT)-like uncharacterized protein
MKKTKQFNTGVKEQLSWPQRLLLSVIAALMRAWSWTLRFHWAADVEAILQNPPPPSVVILWHNRLFAVPAFFRRYFLARKLSVLISASGDGAWLAALLKKIGMQPVRGSRHKRGSQALRELIRASSDGCDIGITPDGSRGPMYDLKPGAISVALKTGAPIVLLSFNFAHAWRLKSWDRLYVPMPFSRIEVKIDNVGTNFDGDDPEAISNYLKVRLDAITIDS